MRARDDGRPSGAALDVADLPLSGPATPPRRNGELVFEAPWQGRAFGMALAVVRRLNLSWREFQRHLIAAIAASPDAPYYDSWVAALEALVVERGLASPGAIADACRRVIDDD